MTSNAKEDARRQPGDERIVLKGQLKTVTGLHVGSGYGSERTDATVIRDTWGKPYIPGSSFKGALRSAVERLIAGLDEKAIRSCQLTDGYGLCLTTNRSWQDEFATLRDGMTGPTFDEQKLVDFLYGEKGLCDTCWLFGSPFNQSRLLVQDLAWLPGAHQEAEKRGEIRHGVGIDRDTQTARDQIKFDFEALPSQLVFQLELIVEKPSAMDLALLAVGLQEMILGFVPLGGIRSRGLGRCQLEMEQVQRTSLSDKKAVLAWLRNGDGRPDSQAAKTDADQFIADGLAGLASILELEA